MIGLISVFRYIEGKGNFLDFSFGFNFIWFIC